eukprot:g2187.t1
MPERVNPAIGERKRKSSNGLGFVRLNARRGSIVSKKILNTCITLRQLSSATKHFQCELERLLEENKTLDSDSLSHVLQNYFKMETLWTKAFNLQWQPTPENKGLLSEYLLQSCMVNLRSELIGLAAPQSTMNTFILNFLSDIVELFPYINIGAFFYWGETTCGWILASFIIFERLLQLFASIAMYNVSAVSIAAPLVGVNSFLTSYLVSCYGFRAVLKGCTMSLSSIRLAQKAINGIFAVTPQAVLNSYLFFSKLGNEEEITTTTRLQFSLVFVVCFAVGMTLTNMLLALDRQRAKDGYCAG